MYEEVFVLRLFVVVCSWYDITISDYFTIWRIKSMVSHCVSCNSILNKDETQCLTCGAKIKVTIKHRSNWLRIVLRGLVLVYFLPVLVILTGIDMGTYDYIVEPTFTEVNEFASNGLALVKFDDLYGYINKQGEYLISPQYEYATSFSENGLAAVSIDGIYGYINERNEVVVEPLYEWVDAFDQSDVAVVKLNDKYGVIDDKGELIIEVRYNEPLELSHNGMISFKQNEKYGYLNSKNEIVVNAVYDDVGIFSSNDLAVVGSNGKYGYINSDGLEVITLQYDSAYEFYDDYAVVKQNDKYGIIDITGAYILEPTYDEISLSFVDGLIGVRNGYNWGYINEKGETVIELMFDQIYSFDQGQAHVVLNKKHGFINKDGDYTINPTFNDASNFASNNLASVKVNIFYGYINRKGTFIIEPEFDDATDFISRRAFVKLNRKWGLIKRHHKTIDYIIVCLPVIFIVLIKHSIILILRLKNNNVHKN